MWHLEKLVSFLQDTRFEKGKEVVWKRGIHGQHLLELVGEMWRLWDVRREMRRRRGGRVMLSGVIA